MARMFVDEFILVYFQYLQSQSQTDSQNLGYGKNAVLQRRAARRRDPKRARDSIFPLLRYGSSTSHVIT